MELAVHFERQRSGEESTCLIVLLDDVAVARELNDPRSDILYDLLNIVREARGGPNLPKSAWDAILERRDLAHELERRQVLWALGLAGGRLARRREEREDLQCTREVVTGGGWWVIGDWSLVAMTGDG